MLSAQASAAVLDFSLCLEIIEMKEYGAKTGVPYNMYMLPSVDMI
tara:strand:- start:5 stop:139 length:135 start_codon:yes stop_codon:yes gene_type:complete